VVFAGAAILVPAIVVSLAMVLLLTEAYRRERAALSSTQDQLSDAVGLISKYVPAELASGLLAGTEAPSSGYKRQKVTSFFSDIVGFTELAEEMEPEDLARMLNEYFTEMAGIAERHHGTVDELQGDGLILVFGAPTFRSDREHALDAVRSASEMQRAIAGLNEKWSRDGLDVAIEVRMGINTGVVTVGHFGSGNRLKYTVLGKHVNLAARIQAMCEPGSVLISHATWLLVHDDVESRSLGLQEFKGITRPVEVHKLV
jgi:class 3 adenylate cyclase